MISNVQEIQLDKYQNRLHIEYIQLDHKFDSLEDIDSNFQDS